MQFVYILRCNDQRLYIGCSENLDERIVRHQSGYVPATKERRPVTLECAFHFADKHKAFAFEKYLKSGSGRAFIKKHLM